MKTRNMAEKNNAVRRCLRPEVLKNKNNNTVKSLKNKKTSDGNKNENVISNGYQKKSNIVDSSDEEIENIPQIVNNTEKMIPGSDKRFNGNDSPNKPVTPDRGRLACKKRIIYRNESSDDDTPMTKRLRSDLSRRSATPEYGIPSPKHTDKNEITKYEIRNFYKADNCINESRESNVSVENNSVKPEDSVKRLEFSVDHDSVKPNDSVEKMELSIDHESVKPNDPVEKIELSMDHESVEPNDPVPKIGDENELDSVETKDSVQKITVSNDFHSVEPEESKKNVKVENKSDSVKAEDSEKTIQLKNESSSVNTEDLQKNVEVRNESHPVKSEDSVKNIKVKIESHSVNLEDPKKNVEVITESHSVKSEDSDKNTKVKIESHSVSSEHPKKNVEVITESNSETPLDWAKKIEEEMEKHLLELKNSFGTINDKNETKNSGDPSDDKIVSSSRLKSDSSSSSEDSDSSSDVDMKPFHYYKSKLSSGSELNDFFTDVDMKPFDFNKSKLSSGSKSNDSTDDEINSTSDHDASGRSTPTVRYSPEEDNCDSSEDNTTSDDEADENYRPDDWADRRVRLGDERYRIEKRLAEYYRIVRAGYDGSGPVAEGDRVFLNISLEEKNLSTITDALRKLDAQRPRQLPSCSGVKTEEKCFKTEPLFKENSFEMDPAYLLPKLGASTHGLGKIAKATLNREQELTVERLQDLHKSLVARPADDDKAEDPRGLNVPLMPHQKHALAWLRWRETQKPRGGVLADEMGLGKTLIMVALVMATIADTQDNEEEKEEERVSSIRNKRCLGGTLVVVPASLLAQWEAEVKTRCEPDTIKVEVYHGPQRERLPERLAKNDIVITTYNIVSREKPFGLLFKIYWRRVILDEAHIIRNHKSQPCQGVCELFTDKRWAVTGTPLHNKEMDIYSLLKFLQCSPFDDLRVWKRWVDNRNDAGHYRLSTVMKTLMLRRTKKELQDKGELPPLPDKDIQVIEVQLDPEERLVYDKVMLYSRTLFSQFLNQRAEKEARKNHVLDYGCDRIPWNNRKGTKLTKAQDQLLSLHADIQPHEILVLLIRLRQLCCHPSLIGAMLDRDDIELQAGAENDLLLPKVKKMKIESDDEDEDINDFGFDERVADHLLTSDNPVFERARRSSKIRAVISKMKEILKKSDKIIVVSQWTGVLGIVAEELENVEDVSYSMFTGQVAVKNRQGILDQFNSPTSKVNVLLLSLTAGGVGLNVVGANHLFLIDNHWNPQLEAQAENRIHRFGQTKDVHIYKYLCADTIEERIQALQKRKLALANQVLNGTAKIIGSKLSLDDIKSLFGMDPRPN